MSRRSLLVAVLVVAATASAGSWHGRFDRSGDVLVVCNPDSPIRPPETVRAELLWRLDDGADDHVLGRVNKIEAGPDGCSYLLDEQLKEIAVYDATGRYRRSLGREGDGPGEFRRPHDLVVLDDGSVFVLQYFPGRIFRLDAAGDPLPSYPVPPLEAESRLILGAAEPSPLGLVTHRYQVLLDDDGGHIRTDDLAAIDDRGQVVAEYCQRTEHRHPGDNVREEGVYGKYLSEWHAGPRGEVVVRSAWHEYELTVYTPGGEVDRVVTREYTSRDRRPELVASLQRYYDEQFAGKRWRGNVGPIEYRVSGQDGDIQLFTVRDDGSIWILTSRGALDAPEGVIGTFDVFDNEGRFTREVTLEGEGDYWQDHYILDRDRLYVIANHGEIVPGWHRPGGEDRSEETRRAVLCYRLPD